MRSGGLQPRSDRDRAGPGHDRHGHAPGLAVRGSPPAITTIVSTPSLTFRITDWRLASPARAERGATAARPASVDALLNYETVKTFAAERRTVGRYEDAGMAVRVSASVKANTSPSMLNAI